MNRAAQAHFDDADAIAEAIVGKVGKDVRLALPLGLGKAIHVANALYARAVSDPSVRLRIITALTLTRPRPKSDLERRFLEPIIERSFGDCPELAYAEPMRRGLLPANIQVHEFFVQAGEWLDAPQAQQNYISSNYTHAIPLILARGVNVVAQLVARRGEGADARYNLGGNTDVTPALLEARRAGKADFFLVGQVNDELPYMFGDAEIAAAELDLVLNDTPFALPAPPRRPISAVDHAMGLHVASLIPDGGTLQLGIGSLGLAVAQSLILRHTQPEVFADLVARLSPPGDGVVRCVAPFEHGLYALSEMFADAFLELYRAGILKREVDGAVLDAGFFLGPRDFYQALRELPDAERARFRMRSVLFVNDLYGEDQPSRRAQRVNARFVNNAMMATLLGAVVSDALDDGRVVSGVGGQYNFVAQAFALEDARSILALPAVRTRRGATSSNIRWSYGNVTIPRHLRDVIVTEYGVADIRGRSDGDVIAAMLAITDSQFQAELLDAAKSAGKVAKDAAAPSWARENRSDQIEASLAPARRAGWLSDFPFGADYTDVEKALFPALKKVSDVAHSKLALARLLIQGLGAPREAHSDAALSRLGLGAPQTLNERLGAALVRGGLRQRQIPD